MISGSRRRFLQGSIATAAALALPAHGRASTIAAGPAPANTPAGGILTDVSVYVARWPFRRITADETDSLVPLLRRGGVARAWTSSLDALLHRDVAAVNSRLVEICSQQGQGLLLPFGCVNPTLTDWEEDLRRCHEVHHMAGIRLHPNYHGYKLDDPRLLRIAESAERRGLVVQIATEMEDRRTQHSLALVPPVEVSPLVDLAKHFPNLKLVVLGLSLASPLATRLAGAGRVHLDISHHEGLQGLSRARQSVPADRLLFGSHTPLFVFEANLLKLRESPLPDESLRAIAFENANRLVTAPV